MSATNHLTTASAAAVDVDALPIVKLTREGWLMAAAELIWPRVIEAGGTRPERYRVACGWPSSSPLMRLSSAKRTLGEAWHAGSDDNTREVFISPALDNPVEVMDVLGHELGHAALPALDKKGKPVGHGPIFAALMKGIGWTNGKPTTARAGDEALEWLAGLAKQLGPYPHKKLDRMPVGKQKARLMKVECPDCGCIARMTRVWIDTYLPTCGCGATMVSAEYEVEGEPLGLVQSHVRYSTADGRFELSTTKNGRREERWLVRELFIPGEPDADGVIPSEPSDRWTYCQNRADTLAFIAAVREGEADFPEHADDESWEDEDETFDELEDDELDAVLGEVGDWTLRDEDEYLGDDEDETPDNPDGTFEGDPEAEAIFEAEAAKRDESGTRKSAAIVAAGGEGALD